MAPEGRGKRSGHQGSGGEMHFFFVPSPLGERVRVRGVVNPNEKKQYNTIQDPSKRSNRCREETLVSITRQTVVRSEIQTPVFHWEVYNRFLFP
jgi:hypothetical protein